MNTSNAVERDKSKVNSCKDSVVLVSGFHSVSTNCSKKAPSYKVIPRFICVIENECCIRALGVEKAAYTILFSNSTMKEFFMLPF